MDWSGNQHHHIPYHSTNTPYGWPPGQQPVDFDNMATPHDQCPSTVLHPTRVMSSISPEDMSVAIQGLHYHGAFVDQSWYLRGPAADIPVPFPHHPPARGGWQWSSVQRCSRPITPWAVNHTRMRAMPSSQIGAPSHAYQGSSSLSAAPYCPTHHIHDQHKSAPPRQRNNKRLYTRPTVRRAYTRPRMQNTSPSQTEASDTTFTLRSDQTRKFQIDAPRFPPPFVHDLRQPRPSEHQKLEGQASFSTKRRTVEHKPMISIPPTHIKGPRENNTLHIDRSRGFQSTAPGVIPHFNHDLPPAELERQRSYDRPYSTNAIPPTVVHIPATDSLSNCSRQTGELTKPDFYVCEVELTQTTQQQQQYSGDVIKNAEGTGESQRYQVLDPNPLPVPRFTNTADRPNSESNTSSVDSTATTSSHIVQDMPRVSLEQMMDDIAQAHEQQRVDFRDHILTEMKTTLDKISADGTTAGAWRVPAEIGGREATDDPEVRDLKPPLEIPDTVSTDSGDVSARQTTLKPVSSTLDFMCESTVHPVEQLTRQLASTVNVNGRTFPELVRRKKHEDGEDLPTVLPSPTRKVFAKSNRHSVVLDNWTNEERATDPQFPP